MVSPILVGTDDICRGLLGCFGYPSVCALLASVPSPHPCRCRISEIFWLDPSSPGLINCHVVP